MNHMLPTLSFLLRNVDYIEICKNVEHTPRTIVATEDIDEDFYELMKREKAYIGLSDEELLKTPLEEIHKITDGEVLNRINRLDQERLTKSQHEILRDWYSKVAFETDAEGINDLIRIFKTCKNVICRRIDKNRRILFDKDLKVRVDDCIEVLRKLTINDYVGSLYSGDENYFGDELLVFKKQVDWVTYTGEELKNIILYIKVDYNATLDSSVVLISFHEDE